MSKKDQKHRSMEQIDSCKRSRGRWDGLKEGERISQRTCMKDPWTGTMVRGLITEVGRGLGGGATKREKVGQL